MKRIAPIILTGSLMFGACGPEKDSVTDKKEQDQVIADEILAKSVKDYTEAKTPEEKFYLQFLDSESYRDDQRRDWKVGDDCLRSTVFSTRNLTRNNGENAVPKVRSDGNLEISYSGQKDILVFEMAPDRLIPGGTEYETEQTIGILAARGCEYGPRRVGYENTESGEKESYTKAYVFPESSYSYLQE